MNKKSKAVNSKRAAHRVKIIAILEKMGYDVFETFVDTKSGVSKSVKYVLGSQIIYAEKDLPKIKKAILRHSDLIPYAQNIRVSQYKQTMDTAYAGIRMNEPATQKV